MDFLISFCFTLFDRIAVPTAYPQAGTLTTFENIVSDCNPDLIVAQSDQLTRLAHCRRRIVTPDVTASHLRITPRKSQPESPAILQYGSGSTRQPRGVVITHANVAANHRMISERFGHGPDSGFVSWLPLFHDMGLMGAVIIWSC